MVDNDFSSSGSNQKTPILRLTKLVLPVEGKKKVAFRGLKDFIYPLQNGKALSTETHGVSFRVKTKTSKQQNPPIEIFCSDDEISFNFKSPKEKEPKRKIADESFREKRKTRKTHTTDESSPEKVPNKRKSDATDESSPEKVPKKRKLDAADESSPEKVSKKRKSDATDESSPEKGVFRKSDKVGTCLEKVVLKKRKPTKVVSTSEESSPEKGVPNKPKSDKAGTSPEKGVPKKRKPTKVVSTSEESSPEKVVPKKQKSKNVFPKKLKFRKNVGTFSNVFLQFSYDLLKARRAQVYHGETGILLFSKLLKIRS